MCDKISQMTRVAGLGRLSAGAKMAMKPFVKRIFTILHRGGGHRALDGGQFRFWSNLKVPFYVHFWHILVIWDILSHIWWTTKQISGSKFSKNWHQKQKKWENAQKQPILDMFWCIWVTKSVSPEFCHSCKVVFCSFFADEDGWEAEKSWNSVKSGFLCQKC